MAKSKPAKPTKAKPAAKKPTKAKAAAKPSKVKPAGKAARPVRTKVSAAAAVEPDVTQHTNPEQDAAVEVAAEAPAPKAGKRSYATADTMAKAQRNISVSEFFAKNRHLLGFDNPRKALLTTIKEAVDNSLDACEEAGIAPCIEIWIEGLSETHFRVTVQDNGPGIVKNQIPNIFGRLLYGSKFHAMKMARGQQGIGISAAGMYGLLTTGKNVQIVSRIGAKKPAHYYELRIDTRNNKPDILRDDEIEWDVAHGTKVTIELTAKYQKGRASVDEYLQQTAIANPHATLAYHAPDGRTENYAAVTTLLPPPAKSVKPHPYGVELGVLIRMLHETHARTLQQFLTSEFSRVSPRVAKEILDRAKLGVNARPARCDRQEALALHEAIQATKIMAPATDCVVPIGKEQIEQALRQVVQAEFYASVTRSPAVYRGNPFIVEAALAYGHKDGAAGEAQSDEMAEDAPSGSGEQPLVKVIRFANRVPLLYQQSACAICKSIVQTNWKSYGLSQARGALPAGPATLVVHLASVWVPFTSESKEAVADYPEITKEIKLALQECGRRLGQHVRRQARQHDEFKKRSYIEKYIPHIGQALKDILDLSEKQVLSVNNNLHQILHRSRKL